jgi:hypothetical protein
VHGDGDVESQPIPFLFDVVEDVEMDFYWVGTQYVDDLGLLVLSGTLLQLLGSNVTVNYDGLSYTAPADAVSYMNNSLVVSLAFMADELGSSVGSLNDTGLTLEYLTVIDDLATEDNGNVRRVIQYGELTLNVSMLALTECNCTGDTAVLTGVTEFFIARAAVYVQLKMPERLYHCLNYTATLIVTNRYDEVNARNLTIAYEHISEVNLTAQANFGGYFSNVSYTFPEPIVSPVSVVYEFDPLLFGWGVIYVPMQVQVGGVWIFWLCTERERDCVCVCVCVHAHMCNVCMCVYVNAHVCVCQVSTVCVFSSVCFAHLLQYRGGVA